NSPLGLGMTRHGREEALAVEALLDALPFHVLGGGERGVRIAGLRLGEPIVLRRLLGFVLRVLEPGSAADQRLVVALEARLDPLRRRRSPCRGGVLGGRGGGDVPVVAGGSAAKAGASIADSAIALRRTRRSIPALNIGPPPMALDDGL